MPAAKLAPAELLKRPLRGREGPLLHVREVPPRAGVTAPWPDWVPEDLRSAVRARGIEVPWRHQVEAANRVRAGEHVIISTGTASGKSLAYLMPVLSRLLDQPRATALYLSPTKALAADQLRSVSDLGLADVRASGYDGDTPQAEREWIRAHARFVLTNPGLPVRAVADDASPRGGVTFGLWEPPLLPGVDGATGDAAPIRRSALMETADLLADAVTNGVRTLAFVRSRRGAEVVATSARRSLAESVPELESRVAAYRAGYLREERRALERALLDGRLLGLAATNALELGIDVAGLDAVVLSGYPGTLASMWQQAGRAGSDALCVLVARDDPLDTYLVHHPETLFGRGVETTVLDPSNPYVLAPHLCCAASELPLSEADLPLFGGEAVRVVLDALVAAGSLRRRPAGWYWAAKGCPDVDLRGTGGAPVSVVESVTGRLLGTVGPGASHTQVHQGAVYLHQGVSYVVDRLDLSDACAMVHHEEPDWATHRPRRHESRCPVGTVLCGCWAGRTVPRRCRSDQPGGQLSAPPARVPRAHRHPTAGAAAPPAAHGRSVVDRIAAGTGSRRRRLARRAGRPARGRTRVDRPAAAGSHVRPVGHRRAVHGHAPGHRHAFGVRL